MQDDELEGMEPMPCGSQSKTDPTRYCVREVGHKCRPLGRVVQPPDLTLVIGLGQDRDREHRGWLWRATDLRVT